MSHREVCHGVLDAALWIDILAQTPCYQTTVMFQESRTLHIHLHHAVCFPGTMSASVRAFEVLDWGHRLQMDKLVCIGLSTRFYSSSTPSVCVSALSFAHSIPTLSFVSVVLPLQGDTQVVHPSITTVLRDLPCEWVRIFETVFIQTRFPLGFGTTRILRGKTLQPNLLRVSSHTCLHVAMAVEAEEEGQRDGETWAKEARALPVVSETRRDMDVHGDGKRPVKCTKNRDKKRCRNTAFESKENDRCIRELNDVDKKNVRLNSQDGNAVHPGRPDPKENDPPRTEVNKRSNRKRRQAVYFLDLHEKHELEMAKKVLSKSNRPTCIVYTLNKEVTHILTRDERSWKNKRNHASSTQEIKGSGRASKLAKVATEQVKELPRGLTHAEICARYGMKIVRFEQIEKQSKKLDLEERLALEKKEATPKLPVLMIEDLSGKFKPIVKEIPRTKDGRMGLPYLDFDAAPGTCPFVFPEKNGNGSKSKKHRAKQRGPEGIKKKRDSQENKRLKWRVSRAGYCEVCSVSFEEYSKHVERPEHIERKRKDPTNKLLDNLFASFGAPAAMPLVFESPIQRANGRPTKAVLTDSPPVSKIGSSTKIESTPQENRGMYRLRRKLVTRSSDRTAHGRITRNAHQKQTGVGMLLRGHRRPLAAVNQ